MEEEHQDLVKPSSGVLRNLKNTKSRENQQRYLSCYYGLRENPKKKTQKSPESMKKILFRCEECGKGFRYEKCLLNHQAGMHSPTNNQRVYEDEEPMKSLCSSFSVIKKKKRSRVIRYKKTPLSCSFTTFLEPRSVSAWNDEELEVAECLILLSKSSPKFVEDGLKLVGEATDDSSETPKGCLRYKKPRKAGEFESVFFGFDQKLMEERVSSYETWKQPASFLGFNNKFDLQRRGTAGEFESEFLSNERDLLKEVISSSDELDQQKLRKGREFGTELGLGAAMECSDSDTESSMKNIVHQCKLCNKIFSSYQALGGHQTYHRLSKSKNRKNCREEPEDESVTVTKEKKRHKCSICSRLFRSVHALGGHKRSHGNRQHSKTEDGEDLGFLSIVPVTAGVGYY